MLKYIGLALIILHMMVDALAACKLPPKSELTIGCSTTCQKSYRTAVYKAAASLGYRVKILTMYNDKLEPRFDLVDGFLVPGGVDIDPKYYKDKIEPELREHLDRLDYLVEYTSNGKVRDPYEYNLWKSYFEDQQTKTLPALGICRGMQMMAVSQGIPLYIDIKTELSIPNRRDLHDKIQIFDSNSKLAQVLGFNTFWGYKNHHQNPRSDYFREHQERWPHLKLTGFSNNGTIAEVLEATNRPAIGVQFHPEQDGGQERLRIFRWLLEKACEHKFLHFKSRVRE